MKSNARKSAILSSVLSCFATIFFLIFTIVVDSPKEKQIYLLIFCLTSFALLVSNIVSLNFLDTTTKIKKTFVIAIVCASLAVVATALTIFLAIKFNGLELATAAIVCALISALAIITTIINSVFLFLLKPRDLLD